VGVRKALKNRSEVLAEMLIDIPREHRIETTIDMYVCIMRIFAFDFLDRLYLVHATFLDLITRKDILIKNSSFADDEMVY
jgi:hypothetical protein